jgi:hypothetical protein
MDTSNKLEHHEQPLTSRGTTQRCLSNSTGMSSTTIGITRNPSISRRRNSVEYEVMKASGLVADYSHFKWQLSTRRVRVFKDGFKDDVTRISQWGVDVNESRRSTSLATIFNCSRGSTIRRQSFRHHVVSIESPLVTPTLSLTEASVQTSPKPHYT